ncbi:MAG: sugar phosphate nucleotidyltransferase, partial [Planctomycetota bacterium]
MKSQKNRLKGQKMPGPELKKPWQMLNVLGVILGGGRGTRLYPLTRDRAKPAVPLLGQYRLIDIPISNCLNSGINRMYALTQFNSESLLRHIANTYKFDVFSDSWVEVLPAQQTHSDDDWYQGTADAVRQNLHFIAEQDMPHVLILSGDQLYRMDYRLLLETHLRNEADVTISCLPVSKQEAQEFGIVRAGRNNHVTDFAEKPAPENLDERFQLRGNSCAHAQGGEEESASYLASMGIYLFNIEALMSALESYSDCDDFGAGIIPRCVQEMDVRAHFFDDYWEDIGTIESFYRANLLMTDHEPAFNFYVENAPVYTHPRFLPPPKVTDCSIVRSLIG